MHACAFLGSERKWKNQSLRLSRKAKTRDESRQPYPLAPPLFRSNDSISVALLRWAGPEAEQKSRFREISDFDVEFSR